ncbi:hypothetical protein [Mesorhizobium australafricanum]|uniref:Uncharacterized protein n=1 Tax=Mesorhizobium australafricanum TaxID=3072311 RepID=A0ABU4X100_9HYPH|nr:hypothetical protein [Mesorhizobium sp. VK3E]MDX8441989.1 hypothetical protein [Mesorhizobium sp. VK3E]
MSRPLQERPSPAHPVETTAMVGGKGRRRLVADEIDPVRRKDD